MSKTWLITGASRGLGADTVRAALAAGHNVVATARRREDLDRAFEDDARLLKLALDVADRAQADAAAAAADARFGGIDVLVNNAGYGHLGAFEEFSDKDVRAQFDTNVFGIFNMCWAVLPLMRRARSGHVINISSIAGLVGGAGGSIYCASKHAVEGFSEGLAAEIAPFGIKVTIVEPGEFRTDFFSTDSLRFGSQTIPDYADVTAQHRAYYATNNHRQVGDPVKLAEILVRLADEQEPPRRFAAGSDAVGVVQYKSDALKTEMEAWRALSISTDIPAAPTPA